MRATTPQDIAEAIERFANYVADELTKQAEQALALGAESALVRAAWAVRAAGARSRVATHDEEGK